MLGIYQCIEFINPTQPVRAETVNCAGFDYNWHMNYNYDEDSYPLIPAGTILHVTSWLDNSATNRGNIDPSNWVGNGQRTIDEMAFAWIGWYDLKMRSTRRWSPSDRRRKRRPTTITSSTCG